MRRRRSLRSSSVAAGGAALFMCMTIHIMYMSVHMRYAGRVTDAAPRPRNAQATRQMILDQARRLFAQNGYAATTVKAVSVAAAVSPNLITRYFGGKEGLFLA